MVAFATLGGFCGPMIPLFQRQTDPLPSGRELRGIRMTNKVDRKAKPRP
jgi:hypothetical protein